MVSTKARVARPHPGNSSGRGLAYWTDGKDEANLLCHARLTGSYLFNAKTGATATTFGDNGVVDLKQQDDQEIDPITGEVGLHATPIVAKERS